MTRRASHLLVVLVGITVPMMWADVARGQLNDFLCYQRPRLPARLEVTLDDALGEGDTVLVSESKRLCLAADHNDQDPTAPDDPDHLAGYRIKQVSPHFMPHKNWVVTDEFGIHVLNIVKPDQVLAPAALSLTGPPAPLTPAVDHFKCYRTAYSKYREFGVKVDDRFGTMTVDIKKPLRICIAADKNDEGILDPAHAMMCYAVNLAQGMTRPVLQDPVFTRDTLGGTSSSAPLRPRELCVPAKLNL